MASRKRAKARRCGHRVVFARMWIGDGWMMLLGDNPKADARRCTDCGAWLSLGPARDDGEHAERIAVEVRAAELALNYTHNQDGQGPEIPSGCDDILLENDCPRCGWEEWLPCAANPKDGWLAGYLARHIATHTEES